MSKKGKITPEQEKALNNMRCILQLPCRPGEILYAIGYDTDSETSCVEKVKCESIEFTEDGISIYCDALDSIDTYVPADFGESIFHSRAEAERKLKDDE